VNLKNIHNVYFIGVGGIGMSAIARYFKANGKHVSGYDKTPTVITDSLVELGIEIHFNDAVANIPKSLQKETSLVVYTPAIPKGHKEYNYLKDNGFTIQKRSEILGNITENTFCLAVAGTHGKTTTSAILGHIMQPSMATSFLGGITENYNSNLILGEDKISVVEADEFDRSFLHLSPNIACITSMDADHLDIYGKPEALVESFVDFSNKVSDTLIVAKGLPIKGLTYAVDESADYKAFNLKIESGKYVFDVKTPTESIENIELYLPGKHNVMNALAALAMANVYGIDLKSIKDSLKTFKGVQRLFSY
jgi:UDP-N-acetylmuramate--alanine ligase